MEPEETTCALIPEMTEVPQVLLNIGLFAADTQEQNQLHTERSPVSDEGLK